MASGGAVWEWVGSTWSEDGLYQVLTWSVSYIVIVYTLIAVMDTFPKWAPSKDVVSALSCFHNGYMSVLSCYMFFGVVLQSYQNWKDEGFEFSLLYCDKEAVYKRGTEHWYWWFFISKFLEYIDTGFLVVNRKYSHTVGWYLQVYHHATTASIAWVAWWHNVPFSWFGIMSNCFVHIVMYAYFAVAVYYKGIRSVGHFVTYIQLIQFYLAVGSAAYTVYLHNIQGAHTECNSSANGIWYVAFMYFSYLVFFLVFHQARSANQAKRRAAKAAKAKAEGGGGQGVGGLVAAAATKAFAPCMMNQGDADTKKTD